MNTENIFQNNSKDQNNFNNSNLKNRLNFNSNSQQQKTFFTCKCSKSKCLKKYCDCFSSKNFCNKYCQCIGCYNTKEVENIVTESNQTGVICTCKNSSCVNRYCECFKSNNKCSKICSCVSCYNPINKMGKFEDFGKEVNNSKKEKRNFHKIDRKILYNAINRKKQSEQNNNLIHEFYEKFGKIKEKDFRVNNFKKIEKKYDDDYLKSFNESGDEKSQEFDE